VHVRPEKGYKLDQLKSVAKAVAYFEPMVKLVMPLERKDCVWARNNMDQAALSPELTRIYDQAWASKKYRLFFDWIDAIPTLGILSQVMSPAKSVSWNIINTLKECGTMEFRRPPQVSGQAATNHWIAFTLSFVRLSLAYDFSNINSAPSYEKFKTDITWAANRLGIASALADWNLMNQSVQTTLLTLPEAAAISQLKALKESGFVQKVKSSINSNIHNLYFTTDHC
jgi:hypothetical protein